jgi:hypothetical protein
LVIAAQRPCGSSDSTDWLPHRKVLCENTPDARTNPIVKTIPRAKPKADTLCGVDSNEVSGYEIRRCPFDSSALGAAAALDSLTKVESEVVEAGESGDELSLAGATTD